MAAGAATRRELIERGLVLGAGALASGPLLSHALDATAAADPAKGCGASLKDIEHFVILMQENRSFDSFYGTFPNVSGFDDQNNRRAFMQPGYNGPGAVDGKLLPFHFDAKKPIVQCVFDPTHNWQPQHGSWNKGRNNRFYEAHAKPQWDGPDAAPGTMGYYRQEDIPVHWKLAELFTLCDAYHCSVLGPTQPNRSYAISAWLGQDGKGGGPTLETQFNGQGFIGDFTWPTMPESFAAHDVTWKSYTEPGGQFDNIFTCFSNYKNDPALRALGIDPVYPDNFDADLKRDELPNVSFIQTAFGQSEHPGFSPAAGDYAMAQVLKRIWKYPKIWKKTAVIINYDENGGFFDHVPPPTPEPGTKGEYLTVSPLPPEAGGVVGPVGLGFRAPCLIVSPWSRGGLISSKTFDHTSVLQLLETRFGVEVPNLTKWRRNNTNDLAEAFNFAAKPDFSIPKLPSTSAIPPCAEFSPGPYPVPDKITMPKQQKPKHKIRRPSGPC
jgi:phospholipase C